MKDLIEVFSAEDPDIIVDLRELNTNSSDNYSIFGRSAPCFYQNGQQYMREGMTHLCLWPKLFYS